MKLGSINNDPFRLHGRRSARMDRAGVRLGSEAVAMIPIHIRLLMYFLLFLLAAYLVAASIGHCCGC